MIDDVTDEFGSAYLRIVKDETGCVRLLVTHPTLTGCIYVALEPLAARQFADEMLRKAEEIQPTHSAWDLDGVEP